MIARKHLFLYGIEKSAFETFSGILLVTLWVSEMQTKRIVFGTLGSFPVMIGSVLTTCLTESFSHIAVASNDVYDDAILRIDN